MSLRELQHRCEDGLSDLPLPNPFTIDGLRQNMERARGRTIILYPIPADLVTFDTPCGVRIRLDDYSVLFYRERPTEYQTEHVQLHELTHEWFDHGTNLGPEQIQALMPLFDSDLIARVTGGQATVQARASYNTDEEKIAEFGASLIPRMARDLASDDMLGRLGADLARPSGSRGTRRRFTNPFRRS